MGTIDHQQNSNFRLGGLVQPNGNIETVILCCVQRENSWAMVLAAYFEPLIQEDRRQFKKVESRLTTEEVRATLSLTKINLNHKELSEIEILIDYIFDPLNRQEFCDGELSIFATRIYLSKHFSDLNEAAQDIIKYQVCFLADNHSNAAQQLVFEMCSFRNEARLSRRTYVQQALIETKLLSKAKALYYLMQYQRDDLNKEKQSYRPAMPPNEPLWRLNEKLRRLEATNKLLGRIRDEIENRKQGIEESRGEALVKEATDYLYKTDNDISYPPEIFYEMDSVDDVTIDSLKGVTQTDHRYQGEFINLHRLLCSIGEFKGALRDVSQSQALVRYIFRHRNVINQIYELMRVNNIEGDLVLLLLRKHPELVSELDQVRALSLVTPNKLKADAPFCRQVVLELAKSETSIGTRVRSEVLQSPDIYKCLKANDLASLLLLSASSSKLNSSQKPTAILEFILEPDSNAGRQEILKLAMNSGVIGAETRKLILQSPDIYQRLNVDDLATILLHQLKSSEGELSLAPTIPLLDTIANDRKNLSPKALIQLSKLIKDKFDMATQLKYLKKGLMLTTDAKIMLLRDITALHAFIKLHEKDERWIFDRRDLVSAYLSAIQQRMNSLWTFLNKEERDKIKDITNRFPSEYCDINFDIDTSQSNVGNNEVQDNIRAGDVERDHVGYLMKEIMELKNKKRCFWQEESTKYTLLKVIKKITADKSISLTRVELKTLLCLFLQHMFLHENRTTSKQTNSVKQAIKLLNSDSPLAKTIRELLDLNGEVDAKSLLKCIKENLNLTLLIDGVIFEEPLEYGRKDQHYALWQKDSNSALSPENVGLSILEKIGHIQSQHLKYAYSL